jgi:deoxyribose-phosphate aldolase
MIVSQAISLIDLTSLNVDDTDKTITTLCNKATTPQGNVAAVCVYPQFIELAKSLLQDTSIPVATVVNFPSGNAHPTQVAKAIESAIAAGVDEIDLVIPYQRCLEGNYRTSTELVTLARDLCFDTCLKVILETGALVESELIFLVSCHMLDAGADFIKTSTVKFPVGATLDAAKAMLRAIQSVNPAAGLKVSGGIKTPAQAQEYIDLASHTMGIAWCNPQHLRIGASGLLDVLLGAV